MQVCTFLCTTSTLPEVLLSSGSPCMGIAKSAKAHSRSIPAGNDCQKAEEPARPCFGFLIKRGGVKAGLQIWIQYQTPI